MCVCGRRRVSLGKGPIRLYLSYGLSPRDIILYQSRLTKLDWFVVLCRTKSYFFSLFFFFSFFLSLYF